MSEEKNLKMEDVEQNAEEAAAAEEEAKAEEASSEYTHVFRKPFTWREHTFGELTFDWGTLNGDDHLQIEAELLRKGRTLVTPAFTGDYLVGMAARACTLRDEEGKPIVTTETVRKMPLTDFQRITGRARGFLLRAE